MRQTDTPCLGGRSFEGWRQPPASVTVGGAANNGLSFEPVAIHIDPGTTVEWEWSGEGGAHNVVAEDETFDSGSAVSAAGTTFSHTFDQDGIYNYFCEPHRGQGMKGSVAVGSVPRESAQAAAEQESVTDDRYTVTSVTHVRSETVGTDNGRSLGASPCVAVPSVRSTRWWDEHHFNDDGR